MHAPPHHRSHMPRLDPFRFPSETGLRFALLIAFTLGSSIYIYGGLYIVFTVRPEEQAAVIECAGAVLRDLQTGSGTGLTGNVDWPLGIVGCTKPLIHSMAIWVSSGVALLFAAAWGIYWSLPRWK